MSPTFTQLKKSFLDSGFEIRLVPRHKLEGMALDAPAEVKRHLNTNILGLILPDEGMIALTAEQTTDEKAVTLLHEWIHLFDEEMGEEEVEDLTLEIEQTLTPGQFGFLQFLVA